jgi:hypothetical protein
LATVRRKPIVTVRKTPPMREVKRQVTLPSGQEATISLTLEMPDPREAFEPNGTHVSLNLRSGACLGNLSGPAADLEKSLVAAVKLLRESC